MTEANRLSIAGMMVVVAVIALGVVALREGTEFWAGAVFTVTVLLLLGAVLHAAQGRGPQRAIWAGFALFGWTYLLWSFVPWSGTNVPPPPLPTAWLLAELHQRIHDTPQYVPNPKFTGSFSFTGNSTSLMPVIVKPGTGTWRGNEASYRQVGHCLVALLFGCLGAMWSRYIAAKASRPVDGPAGA